MSTKSKEFKNSKRNLLKEFNQVRKTISDKNEKDELIALIYSELRRF